MFEAAGGTLTDLPTEGEVAMFRAQGTRFQAVSVVASLVAIGELDGHLLTTPFAITLLPASKRGELEVVDIETAAHLDISAAARESEAFYTDFNPFTGEWGLYGMKTPELVEGRGFLDEIGIVVDAYYLATEYDADDVLAPDIGLPERARERYIRHRRDLLFKPFRRIEARRVWGAHSPIELFLLQELARRELHPQLQMLIMDDGSTFPSLYHLWGDLDFRYSRGLVSEADMYFSHERVAVFCDGRNFHRGKRRQKDEAINDKLERLGITSVRLKGSLIVRDLGRAADLVLVALQNRR
ncbi:hypothetical protein [Sphingopyxis sp.]|uniref:hypothetical protein n=1 Tax=Sphingopyxis sp. TaxID=1908224 RepID=UPI002D7780CA|nr:hypothetical protein [Sphingopyxis sp.]HET6523608.1 hypothetical protein [Sphingopyxis sp.]